MSGTFCDLIKLSQHSWACVHVACPSPTGKAQRGQWFLPRFLHQREAAGPNLHQPHLGLKSKVCLLLAQFAGGRLSATVNCQTATPRPPSSPRPSSWECCLLERSSRAALPGPSALRPLRRDSTGARAVEGGGMCVAPPALPQVFATSSFRPTWPPYRRPVSSRLCSRIRPESAGLIIHSFLPPPLARQPSKGRCVDCLLHGRTGRTLGSDRWKTLGRPRGQGGAARTWLSQLPGGVPGAALGHSTIRPQEGAPAHTCPQVWAPPHSQKFSRARGAASCSCRSVVPKLSPVNKVSAEIESKRLETFVAIVRVILCLLNLMKIWSCISYLFSFHFPRQPFLL